MGFRAIPPRMGSAVASLMAPHIGQPMHAMHGLRPRGDGSGQGRGRWGAQTTAPTPGPRHTGGTPKAIFFLPVCACMRPLKAKHSYSFLQYKYRGCRAMSFEV